MGMSIYGTQPVGEREKLPSATLKENEDTVKGVILSVSEAPDRDFKTKKAKFWHTERKEVVFMDQVPANETQYLSPFKQFVFEMEGKNTFGNQVLEGRFVVFANGRMRKAVVSAAKDVGASEFENGGQLGIKVTSQGPRDFKALYVAPADE